jgi:hypothetical protein
MIDGARSAKGEDITAMLAVPEKYADLRWDHSKGGEREMLRFESLHQQSCQSRAQAEGQYNYGNSQNSVER